MKQQRTQLFNEVLAIVKSDLANGRVTTSRSLVKSIGSLEWGTLSDALKAAKNAVGLIDETPR
jgi:hypothetical protein